MNDDDNDSENDDDEDNEYVLHHFNTLVAFLCR